MADYKYRITTQPFGGLGIRSVVTRMNMRGILRGREWGRRRVFHYRPA